MTDIVVETARAAIFVLILVVFLRSKARQSPRGRPGWRLIVWGFSLITLGVLIDITDNFPALNWLVVIGDTPTQAVLEKVICSLVGALLMLIGFCRWLPLVVDLEHAEHRLSNQNRELEEKVAERTRALQQESRSKSRYLASLSHEIRTPLNAILGFAEVLRDGHLPGATEDIYRQYAADIHASGAHLHALLSDVLDVARIEAGRTKLAPEMIDLRAVLDEAERPMAILADARHIRMTRDEPDTPVLAWADRRAVTQILINLMSNAIKFTPRGGSLTVALRRSADGTPALMVSDTGIGMTPDVQARALRPFERANNAYRDAETGSGLGLAIVHGLVNLHGGRMEISSEPGAGTCITVHLRRKPEIVPPPEAAPGPAAALAGDAPRQPNAAAA